MSKLHFWASSSGLIEIELPFEAVKDCSHPGPCDADVEYWQGKLLLNLPKRRMIRELLEYGAWDLKELSGLSQDELEQKIIWIAANGIDDELSNV